jgi:hypothetical protein
MATQEVLQARLDEAEAHLHKMIVGKAVIETEHGEKSARFRSYLSDIDRLENYIAKLKRQLGQDTGVRGPMIPVIGG